MPTAFIDILLKVLIFVLLLSHGIVMWEIWWRQLSYHDI